MKHVSDEVVAVGEPIIRSALEALHAYHDAKDGGATAGEIERLRRAADLACHAVSEFQKAAKSL
ncbi:hypothetical protein [Pseudomonas sp. VA159-2]|uniref:hypothetical protein n=1 Tax=Pseudomonas sp. VA159-2 TaxID=2956728 RepID=UPI002097D8D7|nr:hypothetical protein [Pseudomonas sp. VA159-2]MCO7540147.1 hypothetical protein [Pseudomonas sp. VA159-2]